MNQTTDKNWYFKLQCNALCIVQCFTRLDWLYVPYLDKFGQVWVSLKKFGPVWTALGKFGQFQTSLNNSRHVWTCLGKLGQIWTSLDQFNRSISFCKEGFTKPKLPSCLKEREKRLVSRKKIKQFYVCAIYQGDPKLVRFLPRMCSKVTDVFLKIEYSKASFYAIIVS